MYMEGVVERDALNALGGGYIFKCFPNLILPLAAYVQVSSTLCIGMIYSRNLID